MDCSIVKRDKFILNAYNNIDKANRLVSLLHLLDNRVRYSDLDNDILALSDEEIVISYTQSIIYIFKKHLTNIYWRLGLITEKEAIFSIATERHIDILVALLTVLEQDNTTKATISDILVSDNDDVTKLVGILKIIDNEIEAEDIYSIFLDVSNYLKNISDTITDIEEDDDIIVNKDGIAIYNDIVMKFESNKIKINSSILKDILTSKEDIYVIYNNKATYIRNIVNKIKYYLQDDKNVDNFIIDMLVINYIVEETPITMTGYMLKDFIDENYLIDLLYKVDNILKTTDLLNYINKNKESLL